MNKAIEVRGLSKSYGEGSRKILVLRGLSLSVDPGEVVAIVGASGSGKSTLMHAIGGLDSFDSGTVKIAGVSLRELSAAKLDRLRNEKLGFVYQFHHLLPEFTALENVRMPFIIRRAPPAEADRMARKALAAVGLSERVDHLPSQLSGGERQRTAIARAIVTRPACVLADEPTGNLDADTAAAVFREFVGLALQSGTAIVIVTHDRNLAASCGRTLELADGVLKPVD